MTKASLTRLVPGVFRGAALSAWLYVSVIFINDSTVLGIPIGTRLFVPLFAIGGVAILAIPRAYLTGPRAPALLTASITALAGLATALVADVGYTMYYNRSMARLEAALAPGQRAQDYHVWHGELFPRSYFPSSQDFTVYKPNVRLQAQTFGEFYSSDMLASSTLTDSVLELRQLTYAIGPRGFRETEPLSASRVFALGDSFVLGYGTDEGAHWVDILGRTLGRPVFNLGVSSTGPGAQLMALEHLISVNRDTLQIDRLLWMVFEGNDLENSYPRGPRPIPMAGRRVFDGTVVQWVLSGLDVLKNQSLIHRWRTGLLVNRAPPGGSYEVDGVRLAMPLYHSDALGYRLFNPVDIERATYARDYVINHPNRPLLDRTFERMREISQARGFRVDVILAPSAARLHGPSFAGFPPIENPHFLDYVDSLANAAGFGSVNLASLMAPFAERELLYYRDDHHWNRRGNDLAARLINEALFATLP